MICLKYTVSKRNKKKMDNDSIKLPKEIVLKKVSVREKKMEVKWHFALFMMCFIVRRFNDF